MPNRTSITVAGNTTTYAYDENDRITSVTPPSPASVINYTWDDNGDLTARGSDSLRTLLSDTRHANL